MDKPYRNMIDYFEKNEIKSIDDWGIDELTTFEWGLEDWLRREFPYLTYEDIFAISKAATKVIVDKYFLGGDK